MKAKNQPLSKNGLTCPIFYKGTLEDKFNELIRAQTKIEKICADENIQPSEKLLDKRAVLESEISRHLINGEKLEDKFMDYCLRHFAGGYSRSVNMKPKRDPSVFDRIPAVGRFIDYIAESKGQKILSIYGDFPSETGIIKGDCEFHIDKSFRYLYVPVEQLFVFSDKKWDRGKTTWNLEEGEQFDFGNYLNIDSSIFSHPGFSLNLFNKKGETWTTDYSKEMYVGGQRPKETRIYVGNELVDKQMAKSVFVTVPKTKQRIKIISPFD